VIYGTKGIPVENAHQHTFLNLII